MRTKGIKYEDCPHLGTHFEANGELHTRRLTKAGRIVCSACGEKPKGRPEGEARLKS